MHAPRSIPAACEIVPEFRPEKFKNNTGRRHAIGYDMRHDFTNT
jgi:hypothetical protein